MVAACRSPLLIACVMLVSSNARRSSWQGISIENSERVDALTSMSHSLAGWQHSGEDSPLAAFASLLLTFNPVASWQPVGSAPVHGRQSAATNLAGSHLRSRSPLLLRQKERPPRALGEVSRLISRWRAEDRNILRGPGLKVDPPPTALTDDICLMPGEPQVRIEVAPTNSRRIFTGIDILAPIDPIWKTLTNYDSLQDVIPSIVKNTVLSRTADGGARLAQVGAANVLPGITFNARTTLDVVPYDEEHPIPQRMLMENLPMETPDKQEREYFRTVPLRRNIFPRPYAYTSLPHRDLTMQNVPGEGDFLHYQGVWRMQELPNCAPEGQSATRLTYAVEVQPQRFLPVALIEGRIAADLKANLLAIKEHVEGLRPEFAV